MWAKKKNNNNNNNNNKEKKREEGEGVEGCKRRVENGEPHIHTKKERYLREGVFDRRRLLEETKSAHDNELRFQYVVPVEENEGERTEKRGRRKEGGVNQNKTLPKKKMSTRTKTNNQTKTQTAHIIGD